MAFDRGTLFLGSGGGAASLTPGTTAISGGADTRVLFNDGGTVGEDAGFTYNKTTDFATLGGIVVGAGSKTANSIRFGGVAGLNGRAGTIFEVGDGTNVFYSFQSSGLILGSGQSLSFSSAFPDGAGGDTYLFRDAANTLAQRNGTTAQVFNLYNTFTDASNYERAFFSWSGNIFYIGIAKAGTGADRGMSINSRGRLDIVTSGTNRWNFSTTGHLLADTTDALNIGATGGATSPQNIYATRNILSTGATYGIGYATGAGGAVTQITSRSTGVTLNKVTGQITTTADSLAAISIVTFTVTNSAVAATDTIILSKVSGDADTSAFVSAVGAGSFNVSLRNNDAVGADVTAFVFNFAVIKGVTS